MIVVRSDMSQPHIIEGMCRWAGPRIGDSYDPAFTKGISVLAEHGCATVLYTHWTVSTDLRMHVAGEGHWLTKGALAVFFGYPFLELEVRRVTAFVAKKNRVTRRFIEKLGFVYEGGQRHGAPNGDHLIMYGMLADECKWLPKEESDEEHPRRAA